MTNGSLKKTISKLPTGSGIYIFKNVSGRTLYIGKASNLKNRVGQYLRTGDVRLQKMVSVAKKLSFVKTDSEVEALILESQYIKKYKPAFNIMLRDDKNFFYVGLTRSTSSGQAEKFPKIFITHQPHSKYRNIEISSFVGPFTDGTALKTTLRHLRRVFPYCTCKQLHHNYCLNYHIGKCPGFCCLKQHLNQRPTTYDLQLYKKNIKSVKDILGGKKTLLIKKMEKEMAAFGKKEEFDKAIELRNKIDKIKRVFENARIIQNISHSHISLYGNRGKNIVGLTELPVRIEGYDVANIQGKYAVGAMVVFVDGKPDKNEYRKFKIKNFDISTFRNIEISSSGDAEMLKEVLTRRFRHPEWSLPDLIVVDGGKAKLNKASSMITKLQITNYKQIPNLKFKIPNIIALAKDDKHKGSKSLGSFG